MFEARTLLKPSDGALVSPPPLGMPLPENGTVHVWQLAAPSEPPAQTEISLLAWPERSRAGNFLRNTDRIRFLWRRTMLRNIVAGYCGISPADIVFNSNRYGKPLLAGRPLAFNCAHSDNQIIVAATIGMSVGIDLERMCSDVEWKPVADIAFHPAEIAWIASRTNTKDAFSQIWTRREALFKAWGKGLHDSMRETSLVHDDKLVISVPDPEGDDWWILPLPAPAGYHAALAASAQVSHVDLLAYPSGEPL